MVHGPKERILHSRETGVTLITRRTGGCGHDFPDTVDRTRRDPARDPADAAAGTTNPQNSAQGGAVVSLVGCVEHVTAPTAARGTTQPAPQRPAFKLIDAQPGAGTRTTLKAESQFLLAVATSLSTPIDLAKFQNQWVEVTGTITPVPSAKENPPVAARPAGETVQLPTFTLTSLKVVSTECR